MPLKLVTGPPSSGKTGSIYRVLREVTGAGGRAVLLLPSAADVVRARSEFAADAEVGLRIEQIDRFAESEWARRGDGRRIAGRVQRAALLGESLARSGLDDLPGQGIIWLLETIAVAASACGAPRGVRRPGVAGELLAVLDEYFSRLEICGLVEPADAMRLMASEPPDTDMLAAHRFSGLAPEQEALLVGWGSGALEVFVSLPWAEDLPATESLSPLVDRLVHAGAEHERAYAQADGGELEALATGLFAGTAALVPSGAVRAGLAHGEEAEARLIARYVRDQVTAGVPLGRIAICFRDPARHVSQLRRALERAGVPAEFDVREPVTRTPLGTALQHLWAFALGGGVEDLVAFARTPFSGLPQVECDLIDRSVRLTGGLGAAGARAPLLMRDAHEVRRLSDLPITGDTAAEWKKLASRLMSNAHRGDAPAAGRSGASDAAVLRVLYDALDDALELGEGRLSPRELWELFMRGSTAPLTTDPADRVLVTDVERLSGRRFDAVIIGGLTAGEFPRPGAEDRLQGDAVRDVLMALGVAPESGAGAGAERLSFYLAVTRARRFLGLVRQETDDEGHALRRSVFWDEFLDLYRPPGGESALAIETEGISPSDDVAVVTACRQETRGVVADESARRLLAEREVLSAGEIEAYADCPYRWYHDHVVHPRGLDSPLDRMAAGSAAHRALATFYQLWRGKHGNARVTPALLDLARDVAMEAVREAVAALPEPADLEEQQLAASVRDGVLSIVERDTTFLPGYEPAFVEWAFGTADGDDGVDLGGVRIKGRADRIDLGPAGLVVIDYKRSTALSLAKIVAEGRLQLQLYALAASERLGVPVAGGLYRRLDKPDDRGFVLNGVDGAFKAKDMVDAAGLREVLDAAVERARSAATGIRESRIEPSVDARGCAWCAASAFCGVAH